MKRIVLLSAGAALALSLAACDRGKAPAGDAASAEASTADTDAITKAEADLLAAIAAKDMAATTALYADDAVMAIPFEAPARGKDAITASYDEFYKDPAGKFEATQESAVVSGDMGYTQGSYTVSYTDSETNKAESGQGYYVVVYRKQPDGSWKIVQDISTPTPPPAG